MISVNQILGCGTLLITSLGSLHADPNRSDPAAPMAVHDTFAGAAEISVQAYRKLAEAEGLYLQIQQLIHSGQAQRLPAKRIGTTSVGLIQAERLALQLQDMGEPAGIDIAFRFKRMYPEFRQAALAYNGTAAGQKIYQAMRVQTMRTVPARVKKAEQLAALLQQDIAAAEAELHKYVDQLQPSALFERPNENPTLHFPTTPVRGMINAQAAKQRLAEKQQHCLEKIAAAQMAALKWLESAAQAADSIRQSGFWTIDGQKLDGPQTIIYFGDRWGEAHVQAMRVSGFLMAAAADGSRNSSSTWDDQRRAKVLQPAIDLERQLLDQASRAIEEILLAELRLDDSQAMRARYPDYLAALAPLLQRTSGKAFRQSISGALAQMAVTAAMQADVRNYQLATEDLLRWRKRVTDRRVQRAADGLQTLPELTRSAFRDRDGYVGLYPHPEPRQYDSTDARLRASAAEILAPALERVIDQSVITENVLRVSPTSRSMLAPLQSRTYVSMPVPTGLESIVADFQRDLLVDDTHPPLTIPAAIALQAAVRGDFRLVAGKIRNVHLDSLISRMCTLPPIASIFAPRGEIPVYGGTGGFLDQAVLRYDLQPSWVQHEHFIATLSKE